MQKVLTKVFLNNIIMITFFLVYNGMSIPLNKFILGGNCMNEIIIPSKTIVNLGKAALMQLAYGKLPVRLALPGEHSNLDQSSLFTIQIMSYARNRGAELDVLNASDMQATVELLADEIQNYAKERNLNILIKTA
jgi:hypothetical protein